MIFKAEIHNRFTGFKLAKTCYNYPVLMYHIVPDYHWAYHVYCCDTECAKFTNSTLNYVKISGFGLALVLLMWVL